MTRDGEERITVQEAARLLGVSRPTVYRLIERGDLSAEIHPVTRRRQLSRPQVMRLLGSPEPASAWIATAALRVRDSGGRTCPADVKPVNSIFQLPKLALDFGVDDLSDRVDYYRFHGLPADEKDLSGHIGADRDELS